MKLKKSQDSRTAAPLFPVNLPYLWAERHCPVRCPVALFKDSKQVWQDSRRLLLSICKRCLWGACLSAYAEYGKTDRPNIPVNASRGARTFSQLGIPDAGWIPMMRNRGSNIRRKAEKSRELRGVQRPLAKSPKLVQVVFCYNLC